MELNVVFTKQFKTPIYINELAHWQSQVSWNKMKFKKLKKKKFLGFAERS